ncbi:MAG: DUF362 domain-containing protein [Candidatus Omnitrophota bacterium]|jgi:uncharacterized protein (DUF362 family)/NAD-dependent dihydropyrimidine dehydrogenase PreA subunit
MSSKVSIVRCVSYEPSLAQNSVEKAIDLLGGITQFIKPASRVLVKPNLLMAKEPEFGIDTHPEVVRAVIRVLKQINCKITVGDGPSVWGNQIENVDEVYRRSGVAKICAEEGVKLVKFDKRRMHKNFPLTSELDECDHLINLPKFKTHDLTLLTGAIKNLFGLVSGTFKTELHKNNFDPVDFAKVLIDIFEEARPSFTLIDGIIAMEGDGPATSGKLRDLNLILASSDCVALDAIMAMIVGVTPESVLSTKEAAARNLGEIDIKNIQVLGEKLEDAIGKPFILPSTSLVNKIPKPVAYLARKLIRYYPYVKDENCIKCLACVDACPNEVISLEKQRMVFDYPKCISCFCCQEACPASAIKVKKSLLAKMIGL